MAEVVMDNPLSPVPSLHTHYAKIINDIKDCVGDLKQEFDESGGFPIGDDFQSLQRFCSKLEYLLQSGIRSKSSLLRSKKDYWNYMCECLAKKKHLSDSIRYVKSITELQTSIGRGRALIRFCLVHQRLADTLQQCILDTKTTSEWYHPKSIWFQKELTSELLNILYDLNDLQFNLSTRDCDLDTSWPTFSRHNISGLAHWSSRVSNISSSLSSLPSVMDTPTSPGAAQQSHESVTTDSQTEASLPQAEDGATCQTQPEGGQPQTEANQSPTESTKSVSQAESSKSEAESSKSEAESSKSEADSSKSEAESSQLKAEDGKHEDLSKEQMEKLLKVAEHEKFALETKYEQEKKEMEHKIINLEKEMMSLKGEIIDWQKKCTEKEIQNEMLSGKLQVKGDVALEKEEMLRVRAEDAEKLLQDFRSDFEKSGDSKSANQKFDMMELRGQLMVQKKKNQALEMNVKSAEMELAAKIKVDAKKTELIDLLDKKLSKQKHEIDYLFRTAQTLIKEKEAQSKKLSNASEELIKLSKKYVESEKVANELRRQNNQLKTMLNSLEGKGKKLMGLAKEKVRSYTDENKRLQEEVDDLRQEIDLGRESLGSKVKTLESTLTATCTEILMQVERLVQKENLDDQGKEELAAIQERIRSLEQMKLDVSGSLSESRDSEEANRNAKLEAKISELTKQNADLVAQVDSMRQECDKLKQEVAALKGQGQGNEGDNRGREALLEEIKVKNDEIEKLRGELGAIRALVLQSVGGSSQEADVCAKSEDDILMILQNVLSNSAHCIHLNRPEDGHDGDGADIADGTESSDQARTLLTENAQLKTVISQTEGQLADLQHKLEVQDCVKDDQSHELCEAKQQVESLLEENRDLKNKVVESLSDLSKKEQELTDMRNRVAEFTKVLEELKESQEATIREKNDLLEKFQDTELKLSEFEENFIGIMTELTSVKDENLKLMEERDHITSELDSVQTEKAELQDMLQSVQSCLETSEKTFHEMKSTIEKLKEEKNRLELALEEARKVSECNQKKYEEERIKNEEMKQAIEEKVKEIDGQKQILIQKEKDQDHELEQFKNDLLQKTQEIEDLKRLLDDFEAEKISVCDRLKDAEDKLAGIMSEKNDSEDKAKDFNYQYITAKSALEEKVAALEDLQQKFEEQESHRVALLTKLEENERDKLHLTEELEEARSIVLQYEATSTIGEPVTKEEEACQTAADGEETSTRAVAVPDIQVENRSLRQQVEKLLVSKDEMCRRLTEEKAALEEHVNALISDLENKGRQFSSLEIQYHSLEEELQKLQKSCDGKSEAIQTLMENMEMSRVEMEALKSKVAEVNDLEAKLSEAEEKVAEMKEDLKKKEKEWEKEADGWEKKVSAVKFQMSASEMEYEETIKKLKTTLSEQNQLQANFDHYEELVASLNMELKQLREEKDRQCDELSQLHKELQNAVKENKILARELVTTNGFLREERSCHEELKQQYSNQKAKYDDISKKLDECLADNRELQKKVVKLVKQKDALWQKITFLDHERQLRLSDKWMDDAKVDKCLNCSSQFSLVLRKHHCRLCGRIFCHDCSNNWIMTPHSSKEERVCSECLMSHSQLEAAGERDDEMSTAEDSAQITDKRQDDAGDGDDDDDDDSDDGEEEEEEHSDAIDVNLDEARLLSMTDDNKSGIVTEEARGQLSDNISHSSDRADTDEAYDLITTDELLESLAEPVPDPNLECHSTITLEQIESGELLCPPELWISAGKMYAVPIFLDRSGVTIHWEFTTKPKGISFSLTYKENDFVTKDNEEVLIDLCKCNSHKEPVIGNLTARRPGIYTLLYDNTTSRFTAKKIDFTLKLMSVEDVVCT